MNEPRDNDPINDVELTAPESLVSALRDRKATPRFVPPEIDRQILKRGHSELARAISAVRTDARETGVNDRKIVSFPGLWVRFAAAAAVVLLGMFVWFRVEPVSQPTQISLEEPTVVEAFLLARKIESGEGLPSNFDLNGDGQVNELDANLLAQRAVQLPEGGAM